MLKSRLDGACIPYRHATQDARELHDPAKSVHCGGFPRAVQVLSWRGSWRSAIASQICCASIRMYRSSASEMGDNRA